MTWARVRTPLTIGGIVLLFAVLLLLSAGAPPFEALWSLVDGSFGSVTKISDTIMAWAPLALAAAGLLVTFSSGLWNIGVEGQVALGAIAATWVARELPGPSLVVIPAMLVAGALGGAIWAAFAGVLRTRSGVNEIFGGLGLDFVATAFATYLVIGPWQRDGVASTGGTDVFRPEAWFPTVGDTRLSLIAPALAIAGLLAVWWLLERTRSGLELKAVGANPASAKLLGIDPTAGMMKAFYWGGALAGLGGAVVVGGTLHKLVPAVSGGRGFLAILVVLLAAKKVGPVAPIALFFAAISVGSSQLQLRFGLDSSLGGVLQGVIVLTTLIVGGLEVRRRSRNGSG